MADEFEGYSGWTTVEQRQAALQGWAIFECTDDEDRATKIVDGKPYGHRPFELQALDEPEPEGARLTDDLAAWEFVRVQAACGSELAKRAQAFLFAHSRAEHDAVWYEAAEPVAEQAKPPTKGTSLRM